MAEKFIPWTSSAVTVFHFFFVFFVFVETHHKQPVIFAEDKSGTRKYFSPKSGQIKNRQICPGQIRNTLMDCSVSIPPQSFNPPSCYNLLHVQDFAATSCNFLHCHVFNCLCLRFADSYRREILQLHSSEAPLPDNQQSHRKCIIRWP